MSKGSLLDFALSYADKGFSVIPLRQDKRPYATWEDFQGRLATPEEIRGWWGKWPDAMIGIVTGKISGICVIDRDDMTKTEIEDYLPDGVAIPTAQTPRGGQHLYFRMPNRDIRNNARAIPGCDFRGEGGYVVAPPSANGTGKAYQWLIDLDEAEPPPLPPRYIEHVLTNAFRGYEGREGDGYGELPGTTPNYESYFRIGRRDEDLFHLANTLLKGGEDEGFVRKVLEKLALSCDPPFPYDEAMVKIASALKRTEGRRRGLSEEIREWVGTTQGYFSTTDLYAELRVTTPEEKKAAYQTLLRMGKAGEIEKHGDKNGVFRRIESQCEDIDFLHASTEPIVLILPFAIHEKVHILPGNIVIIAGEPDAGKTGFLLNVVRENMHRHKIVYFSSEMGPRELRVRLEKFNTPLSAWTFSAKERSSSFADVIQPDAINIIDYLEIHDEFYKVGGMIKEIFDKLRNGIAIIALQKNRGSDFGLGGQRGLEKARLYLTMGGNTLKIVKAKNWATQNNPNNLQIRFKIVNGCQFIPNGGWFKESGGSDVQGR